MLGNLRELLGLAVPGVGKGAVKGTSRMQPKLGKKLPMVAYKQRINVNGTQTPAQYNERMQPRISVQPNNGMQNTGRVEEDYVSAGNYMQPVDYNNHQQPMNGQFLQGQTNARDDYLRRILGY